MEFKPEVFDTPEAVAKAAKAYILSAAEKSIKERGAFHLVLAGGSTPKRCYQLLSETDADWPNWHLYFGDERALPADHPERNSQMAAAALTDRVPIPAGQIHPIHAEHGIEEAAAEYALLIEPILPFDMVLLGMGEDGHTASLFPGQAHQQNRNVVPVYEAPKPPAERVSLSDSALNNCRQMLLLITGEGKRPALKQWIGNSALPISVLAPIGETKLYVDCSALPAEWNQGTKSNTAPTA